MLQVAIVGDRNSGGTTFLGILYAAQVKSGGDREDDFRFHATMESLEEITLVFQRLMSGSFPDSATKEGVHEMRVHLAYRRRGLGIVPFLRSREWTARDFATIRFILLRVLDPDVTRSLRGSSVGDGGRLRDVLDGDAICILVDSTKLAARDREPELAPIREYDRAVDSLLTAIRRWRERGGRRVLHPMFVFTKFDRVNPEVLQASNVEGTPPRVDQRGRRAAFAKALLAHNLPRTLRNLEARNREGLRVTAPSYFFSWIRTDEAVSGPTERIRLHRSAIGGWELEYSRDEYVAFLESLRVVAARTED